MWAEDLAAACEAVTDHPARAWLEARGVPVGYRTPGLGLGTIPEDIPDLPDGFRPWAERVGWTGAVVLVIRDWRGKVVGFQVRSPDKKDYIKFEVYEGASVSQLWGADVALPAVWATGHLVVVEGVFDALACRLAGVPNVVATLSAKPSRLNMRWIRRLAKRVTILYDTDEAGRHGAARLAQDLPGVLTNAPMYFAHDPWDLWVSRPAALPPLCR